MCPRAREIFICWAEELAGEGYGGDGHGGGGGVFEGGAVSVSDFSFSAASFVVCDRDGSIYAGADNVCRGVVETCCAVGMLGTFCRGSPILSLTSPRPLALKTSHYHMACTERTADLQNSIRC